MSTTATTTTVFVGGASQMEQMLPSDISGPMIATGNVGLYGHLSGVVDMVLNEDMTTLTAQWAGTAPGVLEQGEDTVAAKQSVTIKNTSAAAITIPVGTLVSTASGATFQVLEERQPGPDWVSGIGAGDGTYGGYVIEPGASITVTTEAMQDGPAGNALPDTITTIAGIPQAQITASLPDAAAWTMGSGTVTLTNAGNSTERIWVGTTLTGTTGSFVVGNDPSSPAYTAALSDSSSGFYTLAAGASLTVPVFSTNPTSASTALGAIQLANAEDAPAGSITAGALPTGVAITASSAITQGGVSSPSENGTFGLSGPDTGRVTISGQDSLTTNQGFAASEANVNVDYGEMWTTLDLQNWENYVDAERALGVMNVAPIWGDNQIAPFATADEAANIRAAALYGGGLSFDMPPEYVFQTAAVMPDYVAAMVSEIKWANSEGLRTSIIVSPLAGLDPAIMENTEKLIALLEADGAMPSQFIVENYMQVPAASGTYFSATSEESLNGVADYLAGLHLIPSNSESGLEVAGQASADDIVTGMKPSESVAGETALPIFSGARIFAEHASTVITVFVSLSNSALGRLVATGAGTLSADGSSFTASGTAMQVQADLNALSFAALLGANGTEAVITRIVDAVGTISGITAIAVDNALSLTGIAASVTVVGGGNPFAGAVVSEGAEAVPLTATISLSDPSAGSLWNSGAGTFSAGGATLTFTGTVSQIQADLDALSYIPSGATARTTADITLSDGMDTTSANEAIAVTTAGMMVSGLPAVTLAVPFERDAPFQDFLFSASSASAVSTATASLPAGAASLVATSGGTVSASGLLWTASGTAAQIQSDLRGLEVSVPAASSVSSEAVTLNLNGQSTRTTLSIQSTDTVYVGSSSAMTPFTAASVAAPLIATGKIGLYGQQGGVVAAAFAGSLPDLVSAWSSAGEGVGGLVGASLIVAHGTITLSNSTSAAIEVPVGTIAQTAAGVTFGVSMDTGGSYAWQPGPAGSNGYYLVGAGSSLTVPVEATEDGPSGNIPADALTQIDGISGLTVTASALSAAAWAMESGTVTLANNGASAETIYEGDTVSGGGITYQIGNDPAASGFVSGAADSSNGWYVIQPGTSISVPVFSTSAAAAALNAPANSITGTGTLPAGIAITGSSAIAPMGATQPSMQDSFGALGPNTGELTDGSYGQIYNDWNLPQSELDVIPSWGTIASPLDLANWEGYVNNARALGPMNIALMISLPDTTSFATSAMTQWIRAAALYGGGIGFEQSPLNALTIGASFINLMANVFTWAAANGLRSSLILDQGSDAQFAEHTATLLADFKADGGMPSQIIINGTVDPSQPAAEQANGVALDVASLALAPSASESGLNTTGSAAAASIMTGVAPSETALGAAAAQPFAETQVFAQTATDSMTATAALVSSALGSLVAGSAGEVSADGSTFVVSGTPVAVTAALQALSFVPKAGGFGTETLALSITDANGAIQGSTAITVNDAPTLSGLAASQTASGPCLPLAPLIVSSGMEGGQLSASVTLAGGVAAALSDSAGGTLSPDGTMLTVAGTAAAVQSVLDDLALSPTLGAAGTDTLSVSLSDGTVSTRAATTVSFESAYPPVVIVGPGAAADLHAGETLYDEGYGNTLLLPATGTVMISGNAVNNADMFDLRAAMDTTTWNGSLSTLGNYLTSSVAPNGQDLDVVLHPTGGASSIVLATLLGDATAGGAFQRFEQHAMLTVPGSAASGPVYISGPGATATLAAGELLYDTGLDNTLIFPTAGAVTLTGNTANNGDTFDLRAVMATTNWDGNTGDLGSYLTQSVVDGGQDLDIMLQPGGAGSTPRLLATLLNDGPAAGAFTRFEQHALLSSSASSPTPTVIVGPGATASLLPGETLYDEGFGNTLALPAAGQVAISGNAVNNTDMFDLRAAMDTTTWNGSLGTLGNYLTASVAPDGQDLDVLLHPTGGASSVVLASLLGDASAAGAFQRFEQHAILTIPASQSGGAAASPVFISGPGATATLTAGELLYDTGLDNTLIFPTTGAVTLTGNTVNNADTFDLRAVMAAAGWDGNTGDIGNYLTQAVAGGGQDLDIVLHHGGASSSSQVLATLLNDGVSAGAFTRFEQHAML